MEPIRTMIIFGTRPEAIKMAPVVLGLSQDPRFEVRVVVTAQHREMLDQVLELYGIQPDVDLNIMTQGQSLTEVTVRVISGLEAVFKEKRPEMVLVHGDTTTSFAASLAAYYQQIAVGHVEAGLRTGKKYEPFPEEMNRKLTGVLADLHFAPTPLAQKNLIAEGVDPQRISVTGNTVIDALLPMVDPEYVFTDPALARLDWGRTVLVAEAHRRENLGAPLEEALSALAELVASEPQVHLIYSSHPNPVVRQAVARHLEGKDRITVISPPGYREWINLMARAKLVLTDSGGLQEEAPSLGTPVLVMRDVTERPEGIEAGTLKMVGTGREKILQTARELLHNPELYQQMSQAKNPYGDGRATQRIAQAITAYLRG